MRGPHLMAESAHNRRANNNKCERPRLWGRMLLHYFNAYLDRVIESYRLCHLSPTPLVNSFSSSPVVERRNAQCLQLEHIPSEIKKTVEIVENPARIFPSVIFELTSSVFPRDFRVYSASRNERERRGGEEGKF